MAEPTPDEIKAIVDALLVECGIAVDETSLSDLAPRPSASFEAGGSDAAREFLKKDEAPVVVVVPARERFESALTNTKVKGQATKQEAQKALKFLADLDADGRRAIIRAALDGALGKGLSKGAREVLEEGASATPSATSATSAAPGGWMDAVDAKRSRT